MHVCLAAGHVCLAAFVWRRDMGDICVWLEAPKHPLTLRRGRCGCGNWRAGTSRRRRRSPPRRCRCWLPSSYWPGAAGPTAGGRAEAAAAAPNRGSGGGTTCWKEGRVGETCEGGGRLMVSIEPAHKKQRVRAWAETALRAAGLSTTSTPWALRGRTSTGCCVGGRRRWRQRPGMPCTNAAVQRRAGQWPWRCPQNPSSADRRGGRSGCRRCRRHPGDGAGSTTK